MTGSSRRLLRSRVRGRAEPARGGVQSVPGRPNRTRRQSALPWQRTQCTFEPIGRFNRPQSRSDECTATVTALDGQSRIMRLIAETLPPLIVVKFIERICVQVPCVQVPFLCTHIDEFSGLLRSFLRVQSIGATHHIVVRDHATIAGCIQPSIASGSRAKQDDFGNLSRKAAIDVTAEFAQVAGCFPRQCAFDFLEV